PERTPFVLGVPVEAALADPVFALTEPAPRPPSEHALEAAALPGAQDLPRFTSGTIAAVVGMSMAIAVVAFAAGRFLRAPDRSLAASADPIAVQGTSIALPEMSAPLAAVLREDLQPAIGGVLPVSGDPSGEITAQVAIDPCSA